MLPNLKHIDDGVNFGRMSWRKSFSLGLQSHKSTNRSIWLKLEVKTLQLVFFCICFRANDTATRKFVIDLYGQNYILDHYSSVDKKVYGG